MNHFLQRFSVLAVIFLSIMGCNKTAEATKNEKTPAAAVVATVNQLLSPKEFASKIAILDNEVLVDVRTSAETANGMIEGAIHIDFRDSEFKQKIGDLDRSKPVMVYCAGGGRSGNTAKMLSDMGFQEIYDLDGGMSSWKQ